MQCFARIPNLVLDLKLNTDSENAGVSPACNWWPIQLYYLNVTSIVLYRIVLALAIGCRNWCIAAYYYLRSKRVPSTCLHTLTLKFAGGSALSDLCSNTINLWCNGHDAGLNLTLFSKWEYFVFKIQFCVRLLPGSILLYIWSFKCWLLERNISLAYVQLFVIAIE